jgi:hypothetical protein
MYTTSLPPRTTNLSADLPRPSSAAYWRPPTATGLHRPELPREYPILSDSHQHLDHDSDDPVVPGSTRRMSATSTEETAAHTVEAARRAWKNNLQSEWERRNTHEEYFDHLPPPPTEPPQQSPWYSYGYVAASQESIACVHRAEELRPCHECQEEIEYRERQGARAAREAREAREAAAARKAFEEKRRRLDEERRRREEEQRKNEEQIVVAAWQRYERGWQDLLNGVIADGRQVRPSSSHHDCC